MYLLTFQVAGLPLMTLQTPGTKVTISGYAESISALSDDKESKLLMIT